VAGWIDDSTIRVEMEADSITTGSKGRGGHLCSPDFLEGDTYATLKFMSTSLEPSDDAWILTGDLTNRDLTREMKLDFVFHGVDKDPYGNTKAFFSAKGELHREDWNIVWNHILESGGVLVGPTIKLELEVQAALRVED